MFNCITSLYDTYYSLWQGEIRITGCNSKKKNALFTPTNHLTHWERMWGLTGQGHCKAPEQNQEEQKTQRGKSQWGSSQSCFMKTEKSVCKSKIWPALYSLVDISVAQKWFCTTVMWLEIMRKSRMTQTSVITDILLSHLQSFCKWVSLPSLDWCLHFFDLVCIQCIIKDSILGHVVSDINTPGGKKTNPWISHEKGAEIQTAASMGANKRGEEKKREKREWRRNRGRTEQHLEAVGERESEKENEREKQRRDKQREADKTRSSHMTGIDCRQD